jgi:multidrug efflux system membrane fusion protein
LWALTQEKSTGIDIMSFEETPESHLAASGLPQHPSARKGSWLRIVVYVVLLTVLGLIVWRVYQNQKQSAAASASQAAALLSRPVPVQVTAAEQRSTPIYLSALGTVTPYMSVTAASCCR